MKKLTDDQLADASDFIVKGGTLDDACAYLAAHHGVKIHKSTLSRKTEVQEALRQRRAFARYELGVELENSLPKISKMILERLYDLKEELSELRGLRLKPTDPSYKAAAKRMTDIDNLIASYQRPFERMLELSQRPASEPDRTQGKSRDEPEDFLASIDAVIRKAQILPS